ncbi:hypothetical protein CAPTEDRAFT_209901 [Capitella teleta]|uniref:G-protein coupled receptors family 3 profile domain-containing protein n=1 Tax=Capitella teleta TaxID=283909 RepID=R7UVD7_CAPTE|nr:hypothetical protein CAPTEDRAFT_209901 [Capitella teleta]|eukprot:ELU07927.1 hypothetical protein CAPTEDRAFT_209901 [Capitella teleta]
MTGFFYTVIFLVSLTTVSCSLAETRCISRNPIVQEDADAFIGVILSLREHSDSERPCASMYGYPTTGLKIVDSCQSKEFGASALLDWYPKLMESGGLCQPSKTHLFLGVIGESQSNTTAAVADFLSQFHITQISYESTATYLRNLTSYPYLLKTIPSSQRQINVAIDLLLELSWNQFIIVYDNIEESFHQFNLLSDLIDNEELCTVATVKLDPPQQGLQYYYQHLISRVLASETKAVVYIGQKSNYLDFIKEMSTNGETGTLQWLVLTIDEPLQVDDLNENTHYRGILTIQHLPRLLPEFENHWVKIDPNDPPWYDMWFKEWYMLRHKCKLKNISTAPFNDYDDCPELDEATRREEYHPSIKTEGSVLALYTYARALRDAHKALCGGTPGLCNALFDLTPKQFFTDYIKNNGFTFEYQERIPSLASSNLSPFFRPKSVEFDATQEIEETTYKVINFNNKSGNFQLSEVGIYMDDYLSVSWIDIEFYDLNRTKVLKSPPTYSCHDGQCMECQEMTAFDWRTPEIYYTPGDILIAGVFSLHEKYTFSCGKFIDQEAQLIAAYQYGLQSANQMAIFNNGLKLGGVVIDDCSNSLYAAATLASLLSGDKREEFPGADFILGGVAGDFRGLIPKLVSEGVDLSVIGYEADGLLISENYHYNYSAISVPSVVHEVQALAILLKRLGWTYIQFIFTEDDTMLKTVKDILADHEICIAKAYIIKPSTSYADLCTQMMRVPGANVIALFGNKDHYKKLISAVAGLYPAFEDFVMITGPGIGRSLDLVQKFGGTVNRDISLSYRTTNIPGYIEFIRSINPFTVVKENEWFREWYQEAFYCFLDADHPGPYTQKCFGYPITSATNFRSNDYVISILNSVLSLAQGIHKTLVDICGADYDYVCSESLISEEYKTLLIQNIMSTKFTDESGNQFEFSNKEAPRIIDAHLLDGGSFYEVGSYSSKSGVLAFNEENLERISRKISSECPTVNCLECTYMFYGDDEHLLLPGDFNIGGLFNLHIDGFNPYSCGTATRADNIQAIEAFISAIQDVNNGTAPVSLQDVQLGAVIFDSCSSPPRASRLLGSFYTEDVRIEPHTRDHTLAWVTSASEITFDVARLLADLHIPQIGVYSDSYKLYQNSQTEDVFYTISNSQEMARALANFLNAMKWKYVSIVYSANEWCLSFLDAIQSLFTERNICIMDLFSIAATPAYSSDVVIGFVETDDLDVLIGSVSTRQLIVVAATDTPLGETQLPPGSIILTYPPEEMYSTLHSELVKTWLPNLYQNCNEDHNDDCTNVMSEDNNIVYSIANAVYAVANALHLVLEENCGQAYSGICADLQQPQIPGLIQNKLPLVTFNETNGGIFKIDDNYFHQGYVFILTKSDGSFETIAEYRELTLEFLTTDLDNLYHKVTSDCSVPCMQCQYLSQNGGDITFQSGDIVIGGIFDVHETGDGPFTCGNIKLHQGVQLLEAFIYALETVNKHIGMFSDLLNGVELGFLALDACENSLRAANLVTNIHNGITDLDEISSDRIGVYIGAFDSETTMKTGEILNSISVPQITYGPSSSDLDQYPMFLRTVPGDNQQAKAIVAFLLQYDLSYIQVVFSNYDSHIHTSISFLDLAERSGVCVSQTVNAGEENQALTGNLVEALIEKLQKKSSAKVIVAFMESSSIRPLLERIRASDNFKFIGSTSWSNDVAIIEGLVQFSNDIVTFGVETSDVPGFDSYLTSLDPLKDQHQWFAAYYEEICQCSLQYRPSSRFKKPCSVTLGGIVRDCPYQQDPYILYTVNAVFSAALGIDKAIRKICGENYDGLCEDFISNDHWRQMVYDGIQETEFIDATNQVFRYSDQGESTRGFHIYSVERIGETTAAYGNVGSYNETQNLKINTRFSLNWESSCKKTGSCMECPELKSHQKFYAQLSTDNLNLLGLFKIHSMANENSFSCGMLDIDAGFQNALAFFYAINLANSKSTTVQIGGALIDTCGHSEIATRDVLSLVTEQGIRLETKTLSLGSTFAVLVDSTDTNEGADILREESVTVIDVGANADNANDYSLDMMPIVVASGAAIAALTEEMSWDYVSLVYSVEQIHTEAAKQFLTRVRRASSVCIAVSMGMKPDLTHSDAQDIVEKLVAKKGARIVVVFGNRDQLVLLSSASEIVDTNFAFIFGNPFEYLGGTFDVAPGSIVLSLRRPTIEGFRDYLESLTVANHGSIPDRWFEEFWQRLFHCQLQNATIRLTEYSTICSRTDRIIRDDISIGHSAMYTIIATQLSITGLVNIPECQSSSAVGNCLSLTASKRNSIFRRIKEAQWIESSPPEEDFIFRFNEEGEGEIEIQFLNVVLDGEAQVDVKQIGSFYGGRLSLQRNAYRAIDSKGRATTIVVSQCIIGTNCACVNDTGFLKQPDDTAASVSSGEEDRKQFRETLGNFDGNSKWNFVRSLLVKVVFFWRSDIYQKNFFDPSSDKALHPVTLLFIVIALVAVQAAFGAEWLSLDASKTVIWKDTRRCAPLNSHHEELILSCLYPMLLLFLTAVFSGINWENDENNYECRSILISMGSNVGVWIAWPVLAVVQDLEHRDPIITIANLCCGLSVLFGVFGRKLYMLHLYKADDEAEGPGLRMQDKFCWLSGYLNKVKGQTPPNLSISLCVGIAYIPIVAYNRRSAFNIFGYVRLFPKFQNGIQVRRTNPSHHLGSVDRDLLGCLSHWTDPST